MAASLDLKTTKVTMNELIEKLETEYCHPSFMYICGDLMLNGSLVDGSMSADPHATQFDDVEAPGVSCDLLINLHRDGSPSNHFRLTGHIGSVIGYLHGLKGIDQLSFWHLEVYELI